MECETVVGLLYLLVGIFFSVFARRSVFHIFLHLKNLLDMSNKLIYDICLCLTTFACVRASVPETFVTFQKILCGYVAAIPQRLRCELCVEAAAPRILAEQKAAVGLFNNDVLRHVFVTVAQLLVRPTIQLLTLLTIFVPPVGGQCICENDETQRTSPRVGTVFAKYGVRFSDA